MSALRSRRKRQNFLQMGFGIGDPLIFVDFPNETVRVASKYKLSWDGVPIALTNLRKKFAERLGKPYADLKIHDQFGKDLAKIYDETYGPPPRRK